MACSLPGRLCHSAHTLPGASLVIHLTIPRHHTPNRPDLLAPLYVGVCRERERPGNESEVADARLWLAARIRERLRWPEDMPHLHYSIEQSKGRKHLRRWVSTFCEAEGREGVQEALQKAWSRNAREQPLVDVRSARRLKTEGRLSKSMERVRQEREARIEAQGQKETFLGTVVKPTVQNPENIMAWGDKELKMWKEQKRMENAREEKLKARPPPSLTWTQEDNIRLEKERKREERRLFKDMERSDNV